MRVFSLILLASLLLALVLAPAVSAFGTIVAASDPSSASVLVIGLGLNTGVNYSLTTPATQTNVPAGPYVAIASKPGYQSSAQFFNVVDAQTITLFFTLSPLTPPLANGSLLVYSIPSGALVRVYSNSPPSLRFIGTTPFLLNNSLEPGQYLVRINKNGYSEYTAQRTIGPNQTVIINATLNPLPGFLNLYSAPSGAHVDVRSANGTLADAGTTPYMTSLPAGTYLLNFSKSGYFDYLSNATLLPNQTLTVNATLAPLVSLNGSLSVFSAPSAAIVSVYRSNGSFFTSSLTPLILNNTVPPGQYRVNITKSGYQPWVAVNLSVYTNQTTSVNATLTPIPTNGLLTILSNPQANLVLSYAINNTIAYFGITPVMLSLPPGVYSANLTHVGYLPYLSNVTVVSNQSSLLNATLTPIAPVGQLSVDSTPSAGLYVRNSHNEGVFNGNTPAYLTNLTAGNYSVQLTQEGYYTYLNSSVPVLANQTTLLNITLTPYPFTGLLVVYSNPSNASVRAVRSGNPNLTLVGTTPAMWMTYAGNYQVNISHAGYYDYFSSVSVSNNQTTMLNATLVPFAIPQGMLYLNSTPSSNVTVRYAVNGSVATWGSTPLFLGLPQGLYWANFSRPGYYNNVSNVTVFSNQTTYFNATLAPM